MTANQTKENKSECNGKVLQGVVIASKNTDTAVVEVGRYFKHPQYGKFVTTKKKYQVHDAGNEAKIGDKVEIRECRPVSKTKRFEIVK